jgi:RNA polymerase sigma-70 factor (ECF subfamily)
MYKDLAFTVAYRILNNSEDAEEVTQDAFVKAFKNLRSFRQDSAFRTWFYRIVFNTAISKKRLKKPLLQRLEDLSSLNNQAETTIYDTESYHENEAILDRAMQLLCDEERVIITLFYQHESNINEIHEITGLSKSNVKVKLFRARKKLLELINLTNVNLELNIKQAL